MGPPRKGPKGHYRGNGRKEGYSRFAIPTNRCVRGQPIKGQIAPWWLKLPLSRPTYKLRRIAEAA